ncbi:MAG TPA: YdcF family protein [Caulobacteraceae bacterium]
MKGLAAVLVVAAIWLAGMLAFADRIARLTPANEPAPADGIVALTGGSDLRLEEATGLLESGKGRRLLVSGVNRKATRQDVQGVTGAAKPLFDCCVDLGFTAADTLGNARETADWARAMNYRSLILVTADYHMPRAMLELRSALPGVSVTAFPVATPELDVRRWYATSASARRFVTEYLKYLTILLREMLLGLGHKQTVDVHRLPAAAASPHP